MGCKAFAPLWMALVLALTVGFTPPVAAQTPPAINVTGTWVGVNYASRVPGPAGVKLVLQQQGSRVTGTYCVTTGVCGKGEGTISGNTMTMLWQNTTPSCPGQYRNTYQVTATQMMWLFTGEDCLGSEEGHGYAKKEP